MRRIERRIPSMLGLLVLVVAVATGVVLVNQPQLFNTKAAPEGKPQGVRTTNQTQGSFSISWTTASKIRGSVVYGTSENEFSQTSPGETGTTHHITLQNLKPDTKYFFKILSGSASYDEGGKPWSQITGKALKLRKADLITGSVVDKNSKPVPRALIYVTFSRGSATILSDATNREGAFSINLSNVRSGNLASYLTYNDKTVLSIFVKPETGEVASSLVLVSNARPIPTITLGQNSDLRSSQGAPSSDSTSPKSNIQNIKSPSPSPKTGTAPPVGESQQGFTIDNPKEDEQIETSKPEFFGKASSGQGVKVKVDSRPEKIITVTSQNKWSLASDFLSSGKHTLTATLVGQDDQTLTRNFTVVNTGDTPAFVSSSSGKATQSKTPSPTPTLSPKTTPKGGSVQSPSPVPTPSSSPTPAPTTSPTTSLPSTQSGIPTSGNLTMTFILFILGISFIFGGVVLFKKTDK